MKEILLKILELIDYSEDKEAWTVEALGVINLNTFNALVLSLSSEKQKEIENQLKIENAIQKIPQVLNAYFTKEQIRVQFEKSSEDFLQKFLESVFPKLSMDQQELVGNYFNLQKTATV